MPAGADSIDDMDALRHGAWQFHALHACDKEGRGDRDRADKSR
jgi:hypothetical protein